MKKSIRIHPSDPVAVALNDLNAGETEQGVLLSEAIGRGHKFALVPIPAGSSVLKYGMPIGHALRDILPGEKVHTHNMKTNLGSLLDYHYDGPPDETGKRDPDAAVFSGYRRKDGRVGIRNQLWIVPTVGCVNRLAENLANAVNRELFLRTDDRHAVALTHPYGCSQLGDDHETTRRILAGLVRHPNAGGVLVLGLGCENNTLSSFRALLGPVDPERIRFLVAQEAHDEFEEGLAILRELAVLSSKDVREDIPVSELVVGLKCGGSDGLSGITANALVGRFSDWLIADGGSTILTEVPEMFGAETLLMKRCVNESVFRKCVDMVNGFKNYFIRHGQVVYENPSPGNKDGGISTLEDKSMGCTQKAGASPVVDVLKIGEPLRRKGLNLLTGPGNDMVATTLLTASGAHLVLFTTGRGTPFGGVVPTLKISSNSALARSKPHWIDFDAGRLISEEIPPEKLDREFSEYVRALASGRFFAANEIRCFEEIAIFKDGVTL